MADNKKIITDELLKLQTERILQVIADSTYQWESYSDEEIGNLVELDPTQVAELSAVISDTQVAKNKVFSSFHTKELLQENLIEANKYSDDLVANLSNIKLDIVDSLPDSSTVNKSTIYILKDSTGGTNNTLNVWSDSTSAFVEVGKLSVDFTNYYTKSEVDTELGKKANADEVLKPDAIVADLTTTSGSTTLSTAGLQTELDKKIDKTAISTSISSTSTDEEVASAKCINDNYGIKTFTKLEQLGLTEGSETLEGIIGAMPDQSVFSYSVTTNSNTSIYPKQDGMLIINKQGDWRVNLTFYSDSISEQWIGYYQKSSGMQAFRRVCTTRVADVPETRITFSENTNYEEKATSIYSNYEVADGICYVLIYAKCLAPTNSWISINNSLPRPKRFVFKSLNALANATDSLNCTINKGGNMSLCGGTANGEYITTFSYHVAG